MSDSVRPHRRQPTRLPRPWDSPGKNTGVGCHFLLQCRKVKSKGKLLSRVRLFTTPWTAVYQAPPAMGFSRQENWSGVPLPSLSHHPTDSTVDSLASSCCTLLPHHHCSSWAPFSPPDLEILAYTLSLVLGPLL